MITKEDVDQIAKIKNILLKKIEETKDYDIYNHIELLDRVVENLKIAPFSYRFASEEDVKNNFYTAKCEKCGWWGSSKFLGGGGQIADTGDFDDCYCPVCGNADIDEVEH